MEFIGVIGLLAAIILLMVLVFKGYHVLPVTLIVSLVVILTNRVDIWTVLTEGYSSALMGFVGNYLIMFFLGSLFGEVLSKSGAARAIAVKLSQVFGSNRAILIVVLSSILLSYGGVAVFVIIFSIYPIALFLFKEADLPKRIIPGVIMLGSGSFTMTTLPGTPALTNIIPTSYLGTTATAAPVVGTISAIVMFLSGYAIFLSYAKRLKAKGERFVAGPGDNVADLTEEEVARTPAFWKAIIPIVLVISIILGERFLDLGMDAVYIVIIGLFVGTISTYLLFWKNIQDKKETLTTGSEGSTTALLNTASVVGFGGTIQMVPAFQTFVTFATNLAFHPYISIALSSTIIAGVTASSSAGITIFMETMAPGFLELGVNPELLHRIAAMAAGVLDSLPHAGPNVTFLMVTGLTYKEGYPGIAIATLFVPLIGTITAIILALLGFV